MQETHKILFIGDIIGRPARKIVKKFLLEENNKEKYDFVIANTENASHGFGLTKKNHDELASYGIDCFTSGNHIWDKKDVFSYINDSEYLIRPYNYHKSLPGVGYRIYKDKYIVINLLGKTFMPQLNCPFASLDEIMETLQKETDLSNKIIFIDYHAEATAEKQCFARYALNYDISAVVGTHTHVQTADETILDNKCAYLSDAGCVCAKNSIIGMEYQGSYSRLTTTLNERFEVETKPPFIFNACEIEFFNNCATSINRISFEYSKNEDEGSED